jgi:hypothetical protein
MPICRERLHEDLLKLSEGYRSLPPTEQSRHVDDAIEEFLARNYEALRDLVRTRLSSLPKPPGKDDSWSW